MFFLLSVFAASSIFSFDFGSQNVRIAIGVPGKPITIVTNEQGSRATPNFLAYTPDPQSKSLGAADWVVGSEAERLYNRNNTMGVINPFGQLGNPSNSPFKAINPIEAASIAFKLHLRRFKRKRDKIIVAVPSVYTPQARHALVEALNLLNITSVQLLDSNSAVASIYAVEKLKKAQDGQNTTSRVLFVDIGASQTELSMFSFERIGPITRVILEDLRFSDKIGGAKIDDILYKNITAQLPHVPTRAENITIKRVMRRAKERLAAGVDLIIDLSEDFNKIITIPNDQVDELCKDVLKGFSDLITGMSFPDEIELIGGSTRLPSFHNIIQKQFPNMTLRRSLNSDEAVAFGAAYFSSLQTGTIAGSRLEFVKPAIYGLNFKPKGKSFEVIKSGDSSDRKSVTMRKFSDFDFTIDVTKDKVDNIKIDADIFDKVSTEFTHVQIYGLTNLTRSITEQLANGTKPFLRFTFGHSITYDCIDYLSASLNANISVNVTIESEMHYTNSSAVSWALKNNITLLDRAFSYNKAKANEIMNDLTEANERRIKHAEATHKIETFIIDMTDKLEYDNDFRYVTTDEERYQIQQLLSRERQTIELSASRVSAQELEKRLEKVKEQISAPLERYEEFRGRIPAIVRLNSSIKRGEKVLEASKTDDDVIEDYKKFINRTFEIIQEAMSIQPHEKPTVTVKQLIEREKQLNRKIMDLKMPKRKPKTITVSSDPNSPDYSEKNIKKLKKMGINIVTQKDKNKTETENKQAEGADATQPAPEAPEKKEEKKQTGGIQVEKSEEDEKSSGGISVDKDDEENKTINQEL